MFLMAKATASAIWRFSGPVISCASIWPEAAVLAPVVGRGDAGVGEPLFGISGAQQHASYSGVRNTGLVGQQERQLPEGCLGICRAFGSQQWLPERFIQSPESGLWKGLLVERAETCLSPSLR